MQLRFACACVIVLGAWPGVTQAQERAASYLTAAEIDAVLKAPEGGVDRQLGVYDIGDSNVAVGILHRGAMSATDEVTGIVHHQVTEVYYIVSGSGLLTTGGRLVDAQPRAVDSESVTVLVGPSDAGIGRGGETRRVDPGDIIVIPAGVFHGWSGIDDHVTYLSVRPDPDQVLPAGYLNPAIRK